MHPFSTPSDRSVAREAHEAPARSIPRFDWLMTLLLAWLAGGFYIDGWAHNTRPDLETFFTPWHAVMYAAFLVVGAVTVGTFTGNLGRGVPWTRAVPDGYLPSVAGVGIFLAWGIGDLIWHQLFGIESSVEALLSPTHLGLAAGILLILGGPLRAAGRRNTELDAWSRALPPLLSAAFVLSTLTFMTQFINPLAQTGAAVDYREQVGRVSARLEIGGMMLYSVMLAGVILLLASRWRLPAGSIALVAGVNALMMTLMCHETISPDPIWLVFGAVAAGGAGDLALLLGCSRLPRTIVLRSVAFVVPATFALLYFVTLIVAGGGVWWSVRLWTGTIVLSGFCGLLTSLLMLPPRGLEPRLDS